jgi:N-acetylglucosaminyldiphosphoundecaprenol N-acetyl-beta-D-mannosaminyltransferase
MQIDSDPNIVISGIERKRIVSLDLSVLTYQEALNKVVELGKSRTTSYACFSNVHMTIEANKSQGFQKIVNQSTFAFADGMPLVFALRMLYGIRQDRIAGMDFMGDLFPLCETNGLSIFLYGSTPQILTSLSEYVHCSFPLLKIAGTISPPFRPLTKEENEATIDQINSSGANLVFVGLGCPKQEAWMAKNSNQINACLLGVGGAFEIYAGLTKRAPKWMQQVGLEWLYRLLQEPKRLFKRYALTNSKFIYLLMKQFIFKK